MADTLWIDTLVDSDIGSGATATISLSGEFTTQQDIRLARLTLLRTIVRLDAAYVVHDAGEGSQRLAIGIGLAAVEAFSGATTSDPEDASEFPTRGWVWRGVYRVFGFAADQPAISVREIDLDLRSRRKIENGILFLTMNNVALEGAAASVNVLGMVRQLHLVN